MNSLYRLIRLEWTRGCEFKPRERNTEENFLEAAREGRSDIVGNLLNAKLINVNTTNKEEESALNLVIRSRSHAAMEERVKVVELLLSACIDVNALDSDGKSALHYAVQAGNKAILELLLAAKKLEVDIRDKQGRSAFQIASIPLNYESLGALYPVYIHQRKYRRLAEALGRSYGEVIRGHSRRVTELLYLRQLIGHFVFESKKAVERKAEDITALAYLRLLQTCPFSDSDATTNYEHLIAEASRRFQNEMMKKYERWLEWAINAKETIDRLSDQAESQED